MQLTFTTFWFCETVQRKEAIEEHMVNFPLEILGKVQSVVERVLKTKQFGYDVENVEIDCNFKAITLNESKCTPDIVKMTREARKNGNWFRRTPPTSSIGINNVSKINKVSANQLC